MKKFFAAVFAAFLGVSALFADDVADVKAMIVKDCELAAKGDFLGAAERWTTDYQDVHPEFTFSYAQVKRLFLSLDGKHPEEFLITYFIHESRGREPNPREMEEIRAELRNPETAKVYPAMAKQFAEQLKRSAAWELETMKFISVKVDGDRATAVLTYQQAMSSKEISMRETLSLRKIDGEWRIARRVLEKL
jgi:hypothetical protein